MGAGSGFHLGPRGVAITAAIVAGALLVGVVIWKGPWGGQPPGPSSPASPSVTTGASPSAPGSSPGAYLKAVKADHPELLYAMNGTTHEQDLSDHGHQGTYVGGAPARDQVRPGVPAVKFDGEKQYLTVPSAKNNRFSIPNVNPKKAGYLTVEAWVKPGADNYPHQTEGDNYVGVLGKCDYPDACEWGVRSYSEKTGEGRPHRISGYAWNSDADLGSGSDWQPRDGQIKAGDWYHVVVQYSTQKSPKGDGVYHLGAGGKLLLEGCDPKYPGWILTYVNGIPVNPRNHNGTGCMGSEFKITPKANDAPVNFGTLNPGDDFFLGSISMAAIYKSGSAPLSPARIAAHYKAMTGKAPTGSCEEDDCNFEATPEQLASESTKDKAPVDPGSSSTLPPAPPRSDRQRRRVRQNG